MRKKPLAIAIADIHLSIRPPAYRSQEPDWKEAMRRPMLQLQSLAESFDVPILCAGDVFDRWDSKPELINWALNELPAMLSIPGQHDLPYHNTQMIHKSAYQSVEGTVLLEWDKRREGKSWRTKLGSLEIYGFPFGTPLTAAPKSKSKAFRVALVHAYAWKRGCSYGHAAEHDHIKVHQKQWHGWDAIIYGDNHIPFTVRPKGGPTVINCGSLMIRKSDDKHVPSCWILYDDGSFKRYELDSPDDVYGGNETALAESTVDMSKIISQLQNLSSSGLDFEEAVHRHIKEGTSSEAVQNILLEAISHE